MPGPRALAIKSMSPHARTQLRASNPISRLAPPPTSDIYIYIYIHIIFYYYILLCIYNYDINIDIYMYVDVGVDVDCSL